MLTLKKFVSFSQNGFPLIKLRKSCVDKLNIELEAKKIKTENGKDIE